MSVQAWAWPDATDSASDRNVSATVSAPTRLLGSYRPVLGPLDAFIREVDGPPETLESAGAGLPPGEARAEFIVARLRRDGVPMTWGAAEPTTDTEEISYRHGRSSVLMTRADPSVLAYVQVGSWFNAGWKLRLVRRVMLRAPAAMTPRRRRPRRGIGHRLRADVAFWSGVRHEATPHEWRRLTNSSYVVLAYHRVAGEHRPGQEQLDIAPRRFALHAHLLTWLGYRPLSLEEIEHFCENPDAVLGRRRYLTTFDDAYRDNAEPLRRIAEVAPVLFAPTQAVGATASWTDGEPVLSWKELVALEEAGVVIGSHSRSHPRLSELTREGMDDELRGSRDDLAAHLARPAAAVAYPHGDHDEAVVGQAHEAGFTIGFSSLPGRNGAGTHPLCLRRIGIWAQDGPLRFLWKVITAEYAPGQARTAGLGWLTLVRRATQPDRSKGGRAVS